MAAPSTERIEPAFGGLDSDSAPDYLGKQKAPTLENFLVDRPGKLPLRGPIADAIDLYAGALVGKPVGFWSHNNNLLIGLKANSATSTLDPWVAPYRRTNTAAELATHHTTIYHVNLETRAVDDVTSSTGITTPGPRSTRLGDYTYGISYSAPTASNETVNGGLQRRTQLCRWDGTAVLPTALASTVAPTAMQDVRAYLNRLFVLGGNKPNTTGAVKPNSLYYSDDGGPTAGTLAEWQDEDGLTTEIVVGLDDPSDYGVAIAVIEAGMVVFKRRSVWVLRGSSPATFSIKAAATDIGCVDPRSVVEYEGGVFFASDQGYQFFDGAQFVNTTEDLRSSYLIESLAMVGDAGVDGGQVIASRLPNGYLGVSVGQSPATTESSDVRFAGLLHVPARAWATFSSDALSARRPIGFGRGLSRSYIVDDQKIFDGTYITAPEAIDESRRGFDEATTLFTFDESGGGPEFNGPGDALENLLTGQVAWTSAEYSVIPATWHSRLARLSQPTSKAAVKRLLLDYTFQIDGGEDDDGHGWFVSLVDGQGNVLLPEVQLPSQGDPSTYAFRRQHVADIYGEANDAQLRVEWRGTQPYAAMDAAIFGAYIEYQTAQQRGSG